ncbi:MAG: sigma-70 family RNA polymerase sigma factor [Akkermansiaceae bacterium]|nr:sigma-70 family RNA polymerase sigma factor [Akkermansiaceae bacterium]MDP4721582.1 sigma-70 family RNA polymerase sigma factor [Akkermansiaceae bacterium]MDP4779453.1 sigma-70 family RNA polymerase sigma factor [Akkermansiaceae bacterium]MDP4846793.1 sigma-70 family RNA polymerase sigma factor [Akkermansiaceae bacterium]MDP4897130.1 sigma-70 family RNA polymerase sigma factor [Akkermansiaceae bacterium]
MPNSSNNPDSDRGQLFSKLLIANRHRIYGFIYSLVQNHQGAEDLMQEVSMVLWRRFDQFEEGTDFAVWAFAVARYCTLNWRRKQARLPLALDDEDLMRLVDESMVVGCESSDLRDDLHHCLGKLPDKLRKILWARYQKEEGANDIAANQGLSVRSVYLFLEKAHSLLLGCMQRRMNRNEDLPTS